MHTIVTNRLHFVLVFVVGFLLISQWTVDCIRGYSFSSELFFCLLFFAYVLRSVLKTYFLCHYLSSALYSFEHFVWQTISIPMGFSWINNLKFVLNSVARLAFRMANLLHFGCGWRYCCLYILAQTNANVTHSRNGGSVHTNLMLPQYHLKNARRSTSMRLALNLYGFATNAYGKIVFFIHKFYADNRGQF